MDECELVDELTGFMAKLWAERNNMEVTVAGELMAINF